MRPDLDRYNVTWDSPGPVGDIAASMPIGNGDIGVNAWTEQGGDVLLLIGKTDAWDENSINLKLGRIRLKLAPTLATTPFRQTLRLRTGDIEILLGDIRLTLWVDANQPVVYVDAQSDTPFEMQACLEVWRTDPRTIKTQTGDLFKRLGAPDPYPTIVSPDRVLEESDSRVIWCHHNEPRDPDGYEINLRLQGLGGFLDQAPHPLRGRTFGAAMEKSPGRATRHRVAIYAFTQHPSTVEQWRSALEDLVREIKRHDVEQARRRHEQWWQQFWDRSWIDVPNAFELTRAYVLQRFMNAAGGRGAQPIKFNGSIFTVGRADDPDFRRWGGPGFWFMNQRLIYWPMLASGDFDLMMPWLRMYRDMLPLQKHRTHKFFAHAGEHYPETITFWGAEVSAHYGWTPFEQRAQPEAECSYVTYYWTCGLELTLILLSFYAHTQDEGFAREFIVPIADAVTEFFDLHYPRDTAGKLCLEPSQALETWQDATNPTPDVAGLKYTLAKLLDLPVRLTTDAQRQRWARMIDSLPPIPIGDKDGRHVILPAERFDRLKNKENPELYAVFPFRLYGVAKPDLQLARDTFLTRLHASHECWSQDDVHAACLGLTEAAKQNVIARAAPARDSRFPAFWDSHHDWAPDMDHGGVLQIALQNMLMQCEGRQIILLPAWPKEWEVDFRLHAPSQTVVEGRVRDGSMLELKVTPDSRRGDVLIWQGA